MGTLMRGRSHPGYIAIQICAAVTIAAWAILWLSQPSFSILRYFRFIHKPHHRYEVDADIDLNQTIVDANSGPLQQNFRNDISHHQDDVADSDGSKKALSSGSAVDRLALEHRRNHVRLHKYLTDAQLLQDAVDAAAWPSSSSSTIGSSSTLVLSCSSSAGRFLSSLSGRSSWDTCVIGDLQSPHPAIRRVRDWRPRFSVDNFDRNQRLPLRLAHPCFCRRLPQRCLLCPAPHRFICSRLKGSGAVDEDTGALGDTRWNAGRGLEVPDNAFYPVRCTYTYLKPSHHSFVQSFLPIDEYFSWNTVPEFDKGDLRKGEVWMAIKRSHALAVVADHTIYAKFVAECHWSCTFDEEYFQTLLHLHDAGGIANRTVMFVDWSHPDHGASPRTFDAPSVNVELLREIATMTVDSRYGAHHDTAADKRDVVCAHNGIPGASCFLFARKFHSNSLQHLLDSNILNA